MRIDSQNELRRTTSEQLIEDVFNWEGKDVATQPVKPETTKKAKTVFDKFKNGMKAVWRQKYKILLAALGIITLGATGTGISYLIAKKVNRKALPQIKPSTEQEKNEHSEVLETKEKEQKTETPVSPRLVHLTLDRPTRQGIRLPTSHKPYEKLLSPQEKSTPEEIAVPTGHSDEEIVIIEHKHEEALTAAEEEPAAEILIDEEKVAIIENKHEEALTAVEEEEITPQETIAEEVVEEFVPYEEQVVMSEEDFEEILKLIEEEVTEPPHKDLIEEFLQEEVPLTQNCDEEALIPLQDSPGEENVDDMEEILNAIYEQEAKELSMLESMMGEIAKTEEKAPVSKPQLSPVQKPRTKEQQKRIGKINKHLEKLNHKLRKASPKKKAMIEQSIAGAKQMLIRASR